MWVAGIAVTNRPGCMFVTDRLAAGVFAVHPGVVRTRLLESYGLQLPEEWFVGPARAGSLGARLASGRYDMLSGRFLGIDDDLDALLNRTDEIVAQELYRLRIQT